MYEKNCFKKVNLIKKVVLPLRHRLPGNIVQGGQKSVNGRVCSPSPSTQCSGEVLTHNRSGDRSLSPSGDLLFETHNGNIVPRVACGPTIIGLPLCRRETSVSR